MDRAHEMTSDAQTNVGKQDTSDVACAHSQRYRKDSDF